MDWVWEIPCPDPGCRFTLVPVIGCHWWVVRSCAWGLLVAAIILIWIYNT